MKLHFSFSYSLITKSKYGLLKRVLVLVIVNSHRHTHTHTHTHTHRNIHIHYSQRPLSWIIWHMQVGEVLQTRAISRIQLSTPLVHGAYVLQRSWLEGNIFRHLHAHAMMGNRICLQLPTIQQSIVLVTTHEYFYLGDTGEWDLVAYFYLVWDAYVLITTNP